VASLLVAAIDPMNRGLKHILGVLWACATYEVAAIDPMNRGLKRIMAFHAACASAALQPLTR